jgi:hypothetical protein
MVSKKILIKVIILIIFSFFIFGCVAPPKLYFYNPSKKWLIINSDNKKVIKVGPGQFNYFMGDYMVVTKKVTIDYDGLLINYRMPAFYGVSLEGKNEEALRLSKEMQESGMFYCIWVGLDRKLYLALATGDYAKLSTPVKKMKNQGEWFPIEGEKF